jgi:hypothetical protein
MLRYFMENGYIEADDLPELVEDGVVEADREQHRAFLFLLAGQRRFDFVLDPITGDRVLR